MLHVEGGLALALRHDHARIEGAQQHHVPEAGEQLVIRKQPGPGTNRFAVAVQDADDRIGEVAHLFRRDVHLRARHGAGLRDLDVGEIRLAAGPNGGFGDMQAKSIEIAHAVSGLLRVRSAPNQDRFQSNRSSFLFSRISGRKGASTLAGNALGRDNDGPEVYEDVQCDRQGSSAQGLHRLLLKAPALPTGMLTDCHEFRGL